MEFNTKVELNLFEYFSDVYYWNRDSDKFIRINQGGTSCFSPDTRVVTLDGVKPIKDIVIGDYVKTYDTQMHKELYRPVEELFIFNNTKPTVEITLKNGSIIKCTDDHKFYIDGSWVKIKEVLCRRKNKFYNVP